MRGSRSWRAEASLTPAGEGAVLYSLFVPLKRGGCVHFFLFFAMKKERNEPKKEKLA